MAEIVVQIQPDRVRDFRRDSLRILCAEAAVAGLVQGHDINEGEDDGRYINVCFTTERATEFWRALREQVVRLGLQNACIITCTGRDGWNDYLLLYHFDRAVPTDEFRGH